MRWFDDARVVTLARELEDWCERGSADQIGAAWRVLETELDAVVPVLRVWLDAEP